ncbi:MAG: hypothetical protein ACTSR5_16860 [Promethearchaeota archaeon]
MSLDKWIKNDEDNKKAKKKPPKKEKIEEAIEEFEFQPAEVDPIKDSRLLTKFALTCKKEMKIKILDN